MRIREITAAGLMVAITVVLSQIAVPLPFSPVPVSLGVFAVFLCGALLNPLPALLCQLGYLLLGIIGLPVFAKFSGGIGALLGPTGGFLAAYPIMALLISLMTSKFSGMSLPARLAGLVAATGLSMVVCYAMGTGWFTLSQNTTLSAALSACVIPFLLPDLCKIIITAAIAPVLQARLGRYLRAKPQAMGKIA